MRDRFWRWWCDTFDREEWRILRTVLVRRPGEADLVVSHARCLLCDRDWIVANGGRTAPYDPERHDRLFR